MKKVCKIRFYPNQTQKKIIRNTLGACRWVHNKYIEQNNLFHDTSKKFLSGYAFAKELTKLKKNDPDYYWLKGTSSKALKDSIMNCEKSYKRFFKKRQPRPPRFKGHKSPIDSYFFIKDAVRFDYLSKSTISVPILGKIRITEKHYLPDRDKITSGRVIVKNNKYYVMFIYDVNPKEKEILSYGMGIDVGIKEYATCVRKESNGHKVYSSFLKDERYKEIEEKIMKLQTIISNKVEFNYAKLLHIYMSKYGDEPKENYKKIMKGESYNTSNIRKLKVKLRRMYEKRTNYGNDKINKIVSSMVRTKPEYITIEDLDVSSMLENDASHNLHDYIAKSKFYYFRTRLESKCNELGIELRIPRDKYFASSRICSCCGKKKKDLSLSDRTYTCKYCGNEMDRDLNAAVNLCYLKDFYVI